MYTTSPNLGPKFLIFCAPAFPAQGLFSPCAQAVLWTGAACAQQAFGAKGVIFFFPLLKVVPFNCQFYYMWNEKRVNLAVR